MSNGSPTPTPGGARAARYVLMAVRTMTGNNRLLRCMDCRLATHAASTRCTFECKRAEAGETLFTEGDVPSRVVFLRRGQVVLMSASGNRNDASCAVRAKDTLVGVEGAFRRSLPYAVRALTEVLYCEKDAGDFADWLGPLSTPAGATLRLMLEETARRTGERLAVEGKASQRVARFCVCLGSAEGDDSVPVALSLVASVLGMRPETLSRALRELRHAGALAGGPGLRVRDAALLRSFADGTA